MGLPSPEAVARRVRTLSPDDRRQFVADLWDACGWETHIDGPVVVATEGERTKRIAVGTLPDDDRVDTVVVLRESDPIRVRANERGATVVGPAELRDRLLYAIPRHEAERLFETHCGVGLAAAATDSRAIPRVKLAGLAIVVLLAAAGVLVTAGAIPLGDGTPTANDTDDPPTADSTDDPTTQETTFPPGVSDDGIEDPEAMADAHASAVENATSFRHTMAFEGPSNATLLVIEDGFEVEVVAASEDHYAVFERRQYAPSTELEERTVELYGDGTTEYRRTTVDGETDYGAVPLSRTRSPQSLFAFWSHGTVSQYLNTSESYVEVVEAGERYRVTATGTPQELSAPVTEYRAVAAVDGDGAVVELRVEYVHEQLDEPITMSTTFDDSVEPDVPEPDWYEDARAETAD